MTGNEYAAPRVMKVGEEPPPLTLATKVNTRNKPTTAKAETKRKAGSRFVVLNTFIDITMKELNRAEISIWLLLYRDTKQDGLAPIPFN